MTEYAAIFNFVAAIATYSILTFAGIVEMDYIRVGKCILSVGLGHGQAGCFPGESGVQTNQNSTESHSAGGKGDPLEEQTCNGLPFSSANGTMVCGTGSHNQNNTTNAAAQNSGGGGGLGGNG